MKLEVLILTIFFIVSIEGQRRRKGRKGNGRKAQGAPPPAPVALPNNQDFCSANFPALALTNGVQNRQGSCSVTVQGAIPSVNRMVSTIIIAPKTGAILGSGFAHTVTLRTANMQLGSFEGNYLTFIVDPQTRYYASPQQLNSAGQIIGHQHVVAQFVGLGGQPPDASVFDFFKGLDFPAINGDELSVTIPANTFTKRGEYRICTMTGASSHQPVIMPVAQRGPQDDCIRVTVN